MRTDLENGTPAYGRLADAAARACISLDLTPTRRTGQARRTKNIRRARHRGIRPPQGTMVRVLMVVHQVLA